MTRLAVRKKYPKNERMCPPKDLKKKDMLCKVVFSIFTMNESRLADADTGVGRPIHPQKIISIHYLVCVSLIGGSGGRSGGLLQCSERGRKLAFSHSLLTAL